MHSNEDSLTDSNGRPAAGGRPRILITNDDGITAPGLIALEAALAAAGDVYAVAPNAERSAASHSISLRRAVTFEPAGEQRWSVDGTPADCVILALHKILGFLPDLVFSGINPGGNLGRNVFYSGTVAAAVEGSLHGVPSIAMSLCSTAPHDFGFAGSVACQLAMLASEQRLPSTVTLNVNVPLPWNGEVRVTRMGRSAAEGLPRYWQPETRERAGAVAPREIDSPADHRLSTHGASWRPVLDPGTDYEAIHEGAISVTPLLLDRTDNESLEHLSRWLQSLTAKC